jgi:hypothetical protein
MMSFIPNVPPDVARLTDQEIGQLLIDGLADAFGIQPVILDRRGVGSGKTQEALEYVVQHVGELSVGEAIYIFAPTKILCEEIRQRLISMDSGLEKEVFVWRGRAATNPFDDKPMCHFHEAADAVIQCGGDPAKVLCDTKTRKCKYFARCGYRVQLFVARRSKIIVQPHAMLPRAKRWGMGEPVLVVIDEDPYTSLLSDQIQIPLDDIIAPITVPQTSPKIKVDSFTQTLLAVLKQVHGVLNEADSVVGTAGLPDPETISDAIKLLYKVGRSSSGKLTPNPTQGEVKKYVAGGVVAKRAFRLIELLKAIHRSNRRSQIIGCRVSERKVTALLKKYLHEDYGRVPTVILSATAQPTILQKWWSRLEVGQQEIDAAPHETVVQFKTKATQKSLEDGKLMMKKVIATSFALSHMYRGTGGDGVDGLVVLQKEPSLRLKDAAPDNVAVANYGAVAGINDFANVGFQMIVGRPLPHPSAMELIAEVIKGDVIDRRDADFYMGWYPKYTAAIKLKDGSSVPTKMEYHPDPFAAAVFKAVCEGEVAQANRGRGLRRSAENPLVTVFLNDQVPPVPVDQVYEDFPFGPASIMIGKGLVVDARATKGHWQVIAAVTPDWFDTPNAARKYFQRNALSHVPSNGQSHIEFLYGFGRLSGDEASNDTITLDIPFDNYVHAEVTLAGKRYGVLVFIDLAFGDPEEHATQLLGPLKRFVILEQVISEGGPNRSASPLTAFCRGC